MSNIVDLLAAIGAHLAGFELPSVASIHITAGMPTPHITVQPTHCDPATLAQGLLAWADTLTQITAHTWRVPHRDSVHLSITGLLPDGASVLIYGGLPASRYGLGADLAPGATTSIPLAALRRTATEGEARA